MTAQLSAAGSIRLAVNKWRKIPLFSSLILAVYVASFFLPVEKWDGRAFPRSSGAGVFLFCLSDLMYPMFTIPAVLPNVLLWLGLFFLLKGHWIPARICASIATAGAVLDAVLYSFNSDFLQSKFSPASGYYLWL